MINLNGRVPERIDDGPNKNLVFITFRPERNSGMDSAIWSTLLILLSGRPTLLEYAQALEMQHGQHVLLCWRSEPYDWSELSGVELGIAAIPV